MYTFQSRIRYSETDSAGRLTFPALLNYFQDVSTFQSEDLGVGIEYMRKEQLVWVLSFWQLEAERYPGLGERVTIGTLPYEFKGCLGSRNFVMLDEKGSRIAVANSLWTLLHTDTQRPAKMTEQILSQYPLEEKLSMEYTSRKVLPPREGIRGEAITVKKHHLDTNCHVNNGQYVGMAMEYLPEHFVIRQMRAEYKMQAFLGDVLYPELARTDNSYSVRFLDAQGKPYFSAEFK